MDSSKRIFIVEDHEFMLAMLREYIDSESDLSVCATATSGETALESLADIVADLVLIDLSLPGISGLELVAALKAQSPSLPCAILSGHGEAHYVERALAAGAQGYILKGDPDELPDAIRLMLQGERYISKPLQP